MPPKKRSTKRRFGNIKEKGKRFYVEYTGPDKKLHTAGMGFSTLQQADLWLAKEESLVEQHRLGHTTWLPPKIRNEKEIQRSVTVGEWLNTYHANLERGPDANRPSTMQNYRRSVKNRIIAPIAPGDTMSAITRLAGIELVKLTKGDVYQWWDGLQQAYPDAQSPSQQAYKQLKAACAEAVRREMIPVNPVDVEAAKRKPKPKDKYLPKDEELVAIFEAMRREGRERYRVVTSLAFFHGLRIGEAIALERRHVRVEECDPPFLPRVVVTIEQNAQRVPDVTGKQIMMLQPPKSKAGYREVPIISKHVPAFLKHLTRFSATTAISLPEINGSRQVHLLTVTSKGGILMDTSYRDTLTDVKKETGVHPDITPHLGRNWLITRLAEHGAHPKEIGKLLGQEDLDTILKVYMKVREGRTTTLMDKVNETLIPGA